MMVLAFLMIGKCFIFAEIKLQQLKQGARRTQAAAFAPGTYENYITHWVTFLTFCIYFRLPGLPATANTLILYVQHLQEAVLKSAQSVKCYISGIKKLHKILGLSLAGFSDEILQLTLKGLNRLSTHICSPARPITVQMLGKIHTQLDHDNPDDVLFWAACIVAFFLLFRKSNLLPDTKFGFDPLKQLCRDDLLYTGRNILVGIRWAKTHQFTKELLTFPLPILQGSVICPLKALNRVFQLISGKGSDHLFKKVDGSSLTYPQFMSRLRVVLAAVGEVNPRSFTSHSFRRGGASFTFLCGVPSELIKILGDWKSDCYLKYLYFPLEARISASDLMKIRIMHMKHYKIV